MVPVPGLCDLPMLRKRVENNNNNNKTFDIVTGTISGRLAKWTWLSNYSYRIQVQMGVELSYYTTFYNEQIPGPSNESWMQSLRLANENVTLICHYILRNIKNIFATQGQFQGQGQIQWYGPMRLIM